MNDAIYKRKTAIEEKFNVNIVRNTKVWDDFAPTLKKSVLSGDDSYQLALAHCYIPLVSFVSDNLLYNWYDIPFIDMSQPYWNSFNDQLAVNGILPYAASDLIIPDPVVIFFNKGMIKSYDLEDPYELVKSGKWTWDKLSEMAKKVSKDLDGNGSFDENDQYGFMGELGWQFDGIRNSIGEKVVVKDEEGRIVYADYTDKTASIVQKIYDLMYTGTSSFTWPYSNAYDPNQGGWPPVDFGQGRALFFLVPSSASKTYRSTEVDFGILPFPKYDEAQERYVSTNWSGLMAVPATITDPEFVGIITEMLAVESRKYVLPEYYDVMLTSKIARDNESVEMLDIIYDNCEYDLGLNYGGGNMWYMMSQLMTQKKTDIASFYEKNLATNQRDMDKLYDVFLNYGK
ncbi:MAG: hypothetical protein AB9835_07735 [Eubacteriales bacterium]